MKNLKSYFLIAAIILGFSTINKSQNASPVQSGNSNDSDNKGYIGISIGPSVPLSNFANKSGNFSNGNGYANTGAIFDISFGYKLGKYLGISAMLHGQANPTDGTSLANYLAQQNSGTTWTSSSNDWTIGGLLVGGYGSFPIGASSTTFEARAMIGFLHASSPLISLTESDGINTADASISSSTVTSFSYLLGVGFRFSLGSKISLLTNLDYLASSPQFTNIQVSSGGQSVTAPAYTMGFGTINISVGIGYKL